MRERHEVTPPPELGVGVHVAVVLDRHRFDADGLELLGDIDRAPVLGPLADDGVQPFGFVVGPCGDRDPSVADVALVGAPQHVVADGPVRRVAGAPAATPVASYSSSQGESEKIAASTCDTSRWTPRPVRRR